MSSIKRTATQALLPMPTPKRAFSGPNADKTDRALVEGTQDVQLDLINGWVVPVIAKGVESLRTALSVSYRALHNWWNPPILPTSQRLIRRLPSRPARFAGKAPSSAPALTRQGDELPSDSSGQASPPTPNRSGVLAPPPTTATDYGPFEPRHPPREFSIPKIEVALKMTEPIVKTAAMRYAEEEERKQREQEEWIREYQRKLREKEMMQAAADEPGPIRKYTKRRHILQDEFDERCRANLIKALMRVPVADEGHGEELSSYKQLVDYRQSVGASTSSPLGASASRSHDAFLRTAEEFFSDSSFRRSLRNAKEAAAQPGVKYTFNPWYEEQMRRKKETRARKDAELEKRIQAVPKKAVVPKELTAEEQAEVARIYKKHGQINECGKETITRESVDRLKGLTWLNDEVVNFYGAMIQQRADEKLKAAGGTPGKGGKDLPGGNRALDIHVFSSFFYTKLVGEGYAKARIGRWTKKFDIFNKDKIIFPMNIGGMHWTSGCINFREKRIEWYDSLSGRPGQIFEVLRNYLDLEHREKRKKPFDFTGWTDYCASKYPQQQNSSDCGVFTALGMEALARDGDFNWAQSNIPYFRKLMVLEIGRGKLEKIATRDA